MCAIRWSEFKANFKHYDSILADNEPIVLPRREAARRVANKEKRSKIQWDCTPPQYGPFHAELKRIREHCKNMTVATDVITKWLRNLTPAIMDLIIEEGFDAEERDPEATIAQQFEDPYSYVCFDGREVLYGLDWDARKVLVRFRSNGKCEHEGCIDEMVHVHHKIFRSDERDDRMTNLEGLCFLHHRLKHPEKQVKWSAKSSGPTEK